MFLLSQAPRLGLTVWDRAVYSYLAAPFPCNSKLALHFRFCRRSPLPGSFPMDRAPGVRLLDEFGRFTLARNAHTGHARRDGALPEYPRAILPAEMRLLRPILPDSGKSLLPRPRNHGFH